MPKRAELENLILKHQRRLQKLKERKATFGLNTPPEVLTEIEDIEAEIESLQAALIRVNAAAAANVTHPITGSTPSGGSIDLVKAGLVVIVLAAFGIGVFFFLRPPDDSPSAKVAVVTPDTPPASATPTYPPTAPNAATPTPPAAHTPLNTPTPIPSPPLPTDTATSPPAPSFTPTFTPIPPQVVAIIDDFENYNDTALLNDFIINKNAGNEGHLFLVGPPHLDQGRQALAFEFNILNARPNHYIGFDREFFPQDWSNYTALCLWLESDGSNRSIVVQFGESKFKFWKSIDSLANIGVGQHCVSLKGDHQLDLRAIGYYGVYIEGPPQGQGVIYIDDVQIENEGDNLGYIRPDLTSPKASR
ncbi:MAG: hypothetical protein H6631_11850 [Anaerolineaceae bacterium]|nr:hypothetical protein [Anaerolineaceae bacterium]MCB9101397.1 hypothetical protein [Anaerolineales bacterium]